MLQSLKRLFNLVTRRQRWQALLLVVLMLGNALLEMVGIGLVPVYIGILADPERLMQHGGVLQGMALVGLEAEHLTQRTLIYGGSVLLFAVFTAKLIYVPLLAYARARYVQGVVRSQAARLFDGYMRAPYEFHLARHSAELIRNINAECMQLGQNVLSPLAGAASQFLITVAIVVLLIASIPGTALVTLLTFGIVVTPLVLRLSKHLKRLALVAQDGRKRAIHTVQEGLAGVKELRLLGRESYFTARFRSALNRVLALQRFVQTQNAALPVFMEWISVAALLTVVLILFLSGQAEEGLLGMVGLFAVAMARLKGSVTGMLAGYAQLRAGAVSVDVIDRELRHLSEIGHSAPTTRTRKQPSSPGLAGSIRLDDVWFRYAGGADYALRGISLTIKKGEAVGLVGPSGGGKSTLVDVVLGILVPERGSVSVDGIEIGDDMSAWHQSLGYIPQSIYLIDGTVRQNIALGLDDQDIDDAAVARAMQAASLDDFMRGLPEGVDTLIGERGVRLSGGQRQRIAIARALYHDPDALIMDEATSALDNLTEKAVMEAVERLKGDRTILMIAHRLSTVRSCDRIFFLGDGELTGQGTYDELIASHASFAKFAKVHH